MEPSSNYVYHVFESLLKDPDKTILVSYGIIHE